MGNFKLITIFDFIVIIALACGNVETHSVNPVLIEEKLMGMSRMKREYDSEQPTVASLTPDMIAKVVTVKEKYHCSPITPCGWFLYNRRTREDQYFIPNPECECPPDADCARRWDDKQGGTYIYYCEQQIPTTTPVSDFYDDDYY